MLSMSNVMLSGPHWQTVQKKILYKLNAIIVDLLKITTLISCFQCQKNLCI